MAASPVRWLESYEFGTQIFILAVLFDPLGMVLGYLAHPLLGVGAIYGVAIGAFVASWVTGAWVLRHALTNDAGDDADVA